MGALTRLGAAAIAGVVFTATACGGPRVVAVGGDWFVDETAAGKAVPHLYETVHGARLLVDRQIEAYRLYGTRCLIYEASHANGRFLFVAWTGLTPVAFRPSVEPSRWRIDTDGPRLFETSLEPDGRRLLSVEWINYGDPCYIAQMQPRLHEGWQTDVTVVGADRVKSKASVIDVNGEDSVGNSTLADAASDGQLVLVEELLRAGADPNSANQAGVSVLMTAVASRNSEVVRCLIAGGARVNAQDAAGLSALMYAARYRNLEAAKILLDAGAKAGLRDDIGRTAAAHAPDDARQLRALIETAAAK